MFYLKPAKLDYFVKSFLIFLIFPFAYVIIGSVISGFYNNLYPAETSFNTIVNYYTYQPSTSYNNAPLFALPNSNIITAIILLSLLFGVQIRFIKNVDIVSKFVLSGLAFLLMVSIFLLMGNLL